MPARLASSLLLGALVAAVAAAPAAAAPSCRSLTPTGLRAQPNRSGSAVTLRWRGAAGVTWRVLRDGRTVGQTRGHGMRVRVSPSRRQTLVVRAVVNGRPTRCSARLRLGTAGTLTRVAGVTVTLVGSDRVRIRWERSGAPVVAYRLLRDGRMTGQVRATAATLPVASGRTYRFQVAAVDRRGRVGPASAPVTIAIGHVAPGAPISLAVSDAGDTTATLSWGAPALVQGRVGGYRLLREGRVSQTVRGTSVRLSGLPSGQRIRFAVETVDALGWASAPSETVTVLTGHHAPPAPGGLAAADVTDTQLHLAWAPVSPPPGSALRGYRLVRDGVVVGQSAPTDARLGNLAPLSRHTWTVAAVDTLGYVSPASAPLAVAQAAPPAASGSAQAFLLASTDASFTAFQAHYRQIGVVYPTYYDCDLQSAALTGRNDPLVTGWAQARAVKVLPRVNCQDTATNHRILTDPALRAAWLDGIVGAVTDNGYDGINVDFEAVTAADRGALTAFVTELAGRLHALGKLISIDVSGKVKDVPNHPRSTAFDYLALSAQVDWVFVMAWGIHWATSTPGAQDDIRWVKQVADYVATMPLKQKFVMGTMLYAMDWPAGGGSAHPASAWQYGQLATLSARPGATLTADTLQDSWHLAYTDDAGTPHDAYFSDAAMVGDRMTIARSRGLGVGFWRIGQEDERLWSSPLL